MRSMRPGFQRSQLLLQASLAGNNQRLKAWPRGLRPLRCSFASLRMTRIRLELIHHCRGDAPPAEIGNRCGRPTNARWNSENVKSSHQFLARFHRLRWIHPTEHFFPAFTIHSCKFAHELVARFPFCIFAGANAEREKPGDDPNSNVGRGNEKHRERKSRSGNPNGIVFVFGTSSSKSM